MTKKYKIQANLEYLQANVDSAHMELIIEEDRINDFLKMDELSKLEFLSMNGKIVIDDFKVQDHGDLQDLSTVEIKKE